MAYNLEYTDETSNSTTFVHDGTYLYYQHTGNTKISEILEPSGILNNLENIGSTTNLYSMYYDGNKIWGGTTDRKINIFTPYSGAGTYIVESDKYFDNNTVQLCGNANYVYGRYLNTDNNQKDLVCLTYNGTTISKNDTVIDGASTVTAGTNRVYTNTANGYLKIYSVTGGNFTELDSKLAPSGSNNHDVLVCQNDEYLHLAYRNGNIYAYDITGDTITGPIATGVLEHNNTGDNFGYGNPGAWDGTYLYFSSVDGYLMSYVFNGITYNLISQSSYSVSSDCRAINVYKNYIMASYHSRPVFINKNSLSAVITPDKLIAPAPATVNFTVS